MATVLIVDDEPLARERLRGLISEIGGYEVIGECGDGRTALERVTELQPQVVLLDIRMPVMDGIEAARHLAALPTPPAVIFTTAFDDHAVSAFEARAIDYLLKPIRRQRLEEGLSRVSPGSSQGADKLADLPQEGPRSQISLSEQGRLCRIDVARIRYFQADQKYVTVATDEAEWLCEESLKSLEQEFGERFLRIHRNALVAVEHVRQLQKTGDGHWLVSMSGIDTPLTVSRRHLPAVRRRLQQ